MGWETSDRRARLPKDWPKRRAETRRRANGRCEGISLRGERRWHVDECNGVGTDCDHDKRGDDHSLSNLRWLSAECHKAKTQNEARLPPKARPRPRHPGVIP
jgi:5-methylcytosine-specific restriction protein A